MTSVTLWPKLPYEDWHETMDALHMKMQVVGKIKLALNPFLNHWWNVALYVDASGITSGLIPYKNSIFEINCDFIRHNVTIKSSNDIVKQIQLESCSVAEFYRMLMETLNDMQITVEINKLPSEVPDPVPCDIDHRSSYDKDKVYKWWSILVQSYIVFEKFRSDFRGKASPIHFFWGSFDLCGTRFSGKECAPPANSGIIMRFAENEENFTFGFWAGNKKYPKPAFYSYIYPAPENIASIKISPKQAFFSREQGLFLLNYNDVRASDAPDDLIMEFLEESYGKSASAAGWDIKSLKTKIPG